MRFLAPLLLLSACAGDPPIAPAPATPTPKPAAVAPIEPPLLGVLASRRTEVVAAQIDGRILQLLVTSGKHVKAGDAIAEIDPTTLTQRLHAANAAIDTAKANAAGAGAEVSEASRQIALATKMFRSGAGAEEEIRLARAAAAKASAAAWRANAELEEAEANKATVEAQLKLTHVVAPIDGVVSLVKAQQGEVIQPGALIARVFDPNALMVRFQVTRDRRLDVSAGTTVTLTVPGASAPLAAKVTTVSADLEPPLDFAVAEADVVGPVGDAQIGTIGDVHVGR